jgi:phospholipid/cholesterol/gamma-HCH transport system substrate-binding protein
MHRHVIETVMGAVVILVAVLFVYFAYTTAQVGNPPGYPVKASFLKLGGLATGTDVRISGIKVGTVISTELDRNTYDAVIVMAIANDIRLPVDTIAAIASEGPLGDKYVQLQPGTNTAMIAPGGVIKETRSYRSLEDQVGEIIFLATRRSDKAGE